MLHNSVYNLNGDSISIWCLHPINADETATIGRIEDRIARWTMTDVGQGQCMHDKD